MGFPWGVSCATLVALLLVGCSEAGDLPSQLNEAGGLPSQHSEAGDLPRQLNGQTSGQSDPQADPQANGQPNQQRADKRIPEVRSTEEIKITAEGATVKLQLDGDFRGQLLNALKNEPRRSIRLTVTDVERPAVGKAEHAAVIGVSVFLDKPDATSATSGEESHFVGSAIFSPEAQEKVESFLFDLRPTLVRLAELDKFPSLDQPLQITIVPYLADGVKAAPEKLSLPVKSASISLPSRKR